MELEPQRPDAIAELNWLLLGGSDCSNSRDSGRLAGVSKLELVMRFLPSLMFRGNAIELLPLDSLILNLIIIFLTL